MTTKPLRALIYVRLSSYAGESDTTTSPERQEEVCRAYAAAQGWTVVDVVADLDVSGSEKGLRLDRPGLRQVRARWADVDVLLFAKIDRIARNVGDWNTLREEAAANNVALASVAESIDLTTGQGRFVANVLQSFAELEASMISTRTREAVAYLARVGRHRGGLAAFGWQAALREDGPGYRLVLDPDRAPIVREAVKRITGGEPVSVVADDFNARGLLSPEGNGWTAVALRRLLRRPILRGHQVHRGEVVRGADGLPITPHESLITASEWHALNEALAARSLPSTRTEAAEHMLLRGLASCAHCGANLHAVSQPDKPAVWTCSRKTATASGAKCPGVVVSRARLEEHIVGLVMDSVGNVEGTEVLVEDSPDDEALELEAALDAVLAQLRDVDDEDAEAVLLGQRRRLRARLRELRDRPALRTAVIRPTGVTFAEEWEQADDAGKAALLRGVVAVVAVAKGVRGRHGLDPARLTVLRHPAPVAEVAALDTPGVFFWTR